MSLEIGIDYLCGIAAYADLRLAVGEVLPRNQIDND